MNYILFDGEERDDLLPFTFTRPVASIRFGILTIAEKWEHDLKTNISWKTKDYLQAKFPINIGGDNIFINGSVSPNALLIEQIQQLKPGESLINGKCIIATRLTEAEALNFSIEKIENAFSTDIKFQQIKFTYDIFSGNGDAIQADFERLTKGRKSEPLSSTNTLLGKGELFIEPGATIECTIINTTNGPVYIGKDAEVMEGCRIRGPFALCEHAGLKMDAKIYGPTTVGPYCKVGGEVNNAVFFSYSNKGHDGFIGNAVIGEWCNLGADTNNSNLKNTYEEVKLWNYKTERFEKTGLTFCGLMMGDHSKCGINTMFNTGTVVGVAANIFGAGFPRNFLPSFAWGGAQGFETFQLKKMFQVADAMCARRNITFTAIDKAIIEEVYKQAAKYRFWEKTNGSTGSPTNNK